MKIMLHNTQWVKMKYEAENNKKLLDYDSKKGLNNNVHLQEIGGKMTNALGLGDADNHVQQNDSSTEILKRIDMGFEEIKPDNPICPYCGDVTLAYVSLENEWTCKKCKNWYKNSQLCEQKFVTRYLVPCRDSEFHGIECLETEKQLGFKRDECDHRPAHQLWIDKEDAEKLIKIFYQKFAENVRHKGYDFNYNFEELNIRKEVKQEAMQSEARHSSQA